MKHNTRSVCVCKMLSTMYKRSMRNTPYRYFFESRVYVSKNFSRRVLSPVNDANAYDDYLERHFFFFSFSKRRNIMLQVTWRTQCGQTGIIKIKKGLCYSGYIILYMLHVQYSIGAYSMQQVCSPAAHFGLENIIIICSPKFFHTHIILEIRSLWW